MPDAAPISGLGTVLLVEDNLLVAMDTADTIEAMGVAVISVSSVADALAALETAEPGAALVDVHLGTATAGPVAEALRDRGVPFALTTGEASAAGMGAREILMKPYAPAELEAVLGRLAAARLSPPPEAG